MRNGFNSTNIYISQLNSKEVENHTDISKKEDIVKYSIANLMARYIQKINSGKIDEKEADNISLIVRTKYNHFKQLRNQNPN